MNLTEELIFADLKHHVKIHEVKYVNKDHIIFACEIDRIQSVSRGIVAIILKKYDDYEILSSNKNVNNLGFTKIFICKKKDKEKHEN